MKTSFKLLAFLLAAGMPCAALVEIIGTRLPASLDAENLIALFSIVCIGLLLASDYSRRSHAQSRRAQAATPAKSPATETHRLAA